MTRKKRRLTTWLVIAIGCLVIMVAGFVAKDKAVEQWYVWKLESREESERISAAERLAEMRSSRATPRLVAILSEYALRQPDLTRRYGAAAYFPARREPPAHYSAETLRKIGPPALPSLTEALAKEDVRIRAFVYSTLLSIGPATPKELPTLTRLLAHESTEVRRKAVNVLRMTGPTASAAIPALIRTLEEEDEGVRNLAVSALQAIGPARGSEVRVLIDMLEDKANGAVTRWHAATALVHELAVPALASVTGDADDTLSVRRAAAWTLGKLAASSKSAIRALGVALTAEARSVRWIAVYSLRDMGPMAKEAAPKLRRALGDQDRFIREIATIALRNIENAAP